MPKRRCSPMRTLSGESGAGRATETAEASTPLATPLTLLAVARASKTADRAVSSACVGRLT